MLWGKFIQKCKHFILQKSISFLSAEAVSQRPSTLLPAGLLETVRCFLVEVAGCSFDEFIPEVILLTLYLIDCLLSPKEN